MQNTRRGTVQIANNAKGVYYIVVDESNGGTTRYFAHQKNIISPWGPNGLRLLKKGMEVYFKPVSTEKGLQAFGITVVGDHKFKVNEPDLTLPVSDEGVALLRIDSLGRIYAGEKPIRPHVESEGLRVFYTGNAPHLRVTQFELPEATSKMAFVVLDNQKGPRRPDGNTATRYTCEPGAYFMAVDQEGLVRVWNLGRRIQGDSEHWVVLELRFEHSYDFSKGKTLDVIRGQTPTSGMDRDNHQFVPGIMRGLEFMRQVTEKAPA